MLKRRGTWRYIQRCKWNRTTVNNYASLLYGDAMNYSIDLVNYDASADVVTPRDITINLVKEEDFQEIPIHKAEVFEHNGNQVGYLMYNKFVGVVDSDGIGMRL